VQFPTFRNLNTDNWPFQAQIQNNSSLLSELQLTLESKEKLNIFLNSWQNGTIKVLGENNFLLSFDDIFPSSTNPLQLLNDSRHYLKLNHYLELWREYKILVTDENNSVQSLDSYFNLLPRMPELEDSFEEQTVVPLNLEDDFFANSITLGGHMARESLPLIVQTPSSSRPEESLTRQQFFLQLQNQNIWRQKFFNDFQINHTNANPSFCPKPMEIEGFVRDQPIETKEPPATKKKKSALVYQQMEKPIRLLKAALAPNFGDEIDATPPLLERVEMLPSQSEMTEEYSSKCSICDLPFETLQHIFYFCSLPEIKSLSLIKNFRHVILDSHFSKHYLFNLERRIAFQWSIKNFRTQEVKLPKKVYDVVTYWFNDKLIARSNSDFFIYQAHFLNKKEPTKIHFPYPILDFRQLKKYAFMIVFIVEKENFMMIFHPAKEVKQEIKIFKFKKYRVINSSQIALFDSEFVRLVNIHSTKITVSKMFTSKAASLVVNHTEAMSHSLLATTSTKKPTHFSIFDMRRGKEICLHLTNKHTAAYPCSLDKNTIVVKKGSKIYQYDVKEGKGTLQKEYDLSEIFEERLIKNINKGRKAGHLGNFILNQITKKAYFFSGHPLTLTQIDLKQEGKQAISYGCPKDENLSVKQRYTAGNISAFVGPLLLNFSDGILTKHIFMWNVESRNEENSNAPTYIGDIINHGARNMRLNKSKTMMAYSIQSSKHNKDFTKIVVQDFLPQSERGTYE
jgi:hypothetical protein